MFRKNGPSAIRTRIGKGTVVIGEVRFAHGLRIDGEVQGKVLAVDKEASLLHLSESGRVSGSLAGARLIINGNVAGPVASSVLLELHEHARVVGDLHYEALEIRSGAIVEGKLFAPASPRPTLEPDAPH